MPDVLEGVDEDIQKIAEPLVARRAEVLAHRQSLIEERKRSDEVLARIDRALRPLRPDLFEQSQPKSKTRQQNGQRRIGVRTAAGTATGTGITVEACGAYVDEIQKQIVAGAEYVTQIGVYQKVKNGDQAQSSAAFRYLRQIGFLRKGGIKNRREAWYIDRADAYERVLEELNADV